MAELAAGASQPQRSMSSTGNCRTAFAARCKIGVAAARSVGGQQGEPFKHQVEWMRSRGQGWKRPDRAADLEEDARSPEMIGGDGGAPGGQVGPASELEVERFEPSCGLQKQRGSIVAVGRGQGNVASEERSLCALETVERVGLRRGQEAECRVEFAGLEARLCRGQRAPRTPCRVHCQCDGALQECGARGDSAASARSAG